jgi:polyphenol oxidase
MQIDDKHYGLQTAYSEDFISKISGQHVSRIHEGQLSAAMNDPIRHTFENLSKVPGLVHGVFTRHGGVSEPPYHTLNTALNNGDSQEAVLTNLLRVKKALGIQKLASSRQVHGDTIQMVDDGSFIRGENGADLAVPIPCDALATRLRGIGLMIRIADCQALFLVDPVERIVANIHCGWRGSVIELPIKAVHFLKEQFGCNPENILAAVSPSLGPCCAEFINYRRELPSSFLQYQVKPEYFDFWEITRQQLIGAGVRPEHIEIAGRCTVCESDHFFSYRGEHTTGRMAAVIGWLE